MLRVFCGSDTLGVRKRALAYMDNVASEGVVPLRIEGENYENGMVAQVLGNVSLFGEATVCLLDTPSLSKEMLEQVTVLLPALAASGHQFIIIESAPLAAYKKALQSSAQNFEEVKQAALTLRNPFVMADALAARDKKTLWIQLQHLLRAGLRAEEIVGTLWWQLKSMRIAAATKNATEAGMKDFTYNKAKRALSKYTMTEIETLSHDLLRLYHEGHETDGDMEIGLERWVLRV